MCIRDSGSADSRSPIGTSSEAGGKCHACGATFDTADLICQRLMGNRFRELSAEGRKAFEVACKRHGGEAEKSFSGASSIGKTSMSHVSTIASKHFPIEMKPHVDKKIVREPAPAIEAVDESKPLPQGDFPWDPRYVDVWHDALYTDAGANALKYLKEVRGFTDDTIAAWSIGYYAMVRGDKVYEEFISIPMMDEHDRPVNFRFRSVPGKCKYCEGKGCKQCKDTGEVKKKYRPCTGRPLVLFGANSLTEDSGGTVLILEGELDVIAAYQYGHFDNVVSSTAGATTFKEEWLDMIEPYRSFTLALDSDEAGNTGADSIADKLGRFRCARAIFSENDIGACLAKKVPKRKIDRAIGRAKSMLDADFVKAEHFKDEIEDLIKNPDKMRGLPTGSASLDKMLGGWRPGLVVVTADTGAGKTTFSTWALYEQAKRGIPVAITSFENRPRNSVEKLMRNELGGDYTQFTEQQRSDALGKISDTPMHILNHTGHMKFADVVESVRYTVRRHGTRMVLIDHLGFLVSTDTADERREIEAVVRSLALLAYNEEITVVLIAHPSNKASSQGREVTMQDLKGASGIRQDASVVMVLNKREGNERKGFSTSLKLDKCRSEFGLSGDSITLCFSPESVRYSDTQEGLKY